MSLITLEGFHGTNSANIKSIQENNFKPSIGDAEWLGNGTYFFVEGISNDRHPQTAAANWVEASSWDNNSKRLTYHECSVFKAVIEVEDDNLLDLTTLEGMEIFNLYRRKLNSDIRKAGFREKVGSKIFRDGELINLMRNRWGVPIDAVKNNCYIKFTEERVIQADYRVPNCTILAVFSATKNINMSNMKLMSKFRI